MYHQQLKTFFQGMRTQDSTSVTGIVEIAEQTDPKIIKRFIELMKKVLFRFNNVN